MLGRCKRNALSAKLNKGLKDRSVLPHGRKGELKGASIILLKAYNRNGCDFGGPQPNAGSQDYPLHFKNSWVTPSQISPSKSSAM
jgi:hypothetical protein